jgi:hypothetical protein
VGRARFDDLTAMSATRKPKRPGPELKRSVAIDIQTAIDKLSPDLKQTSVRIMEIWRGTGFQTIGPCGRKLWGELLAGLALFGYEPERPSPREEANALIAYCVRNGPLEDLHASGEPLSQERMRVLMIFSGRQLEGCLEVRNLLLSEEPGLWWSFINCYHATYCGRWSKT